MKKILALVVAILAVSLYSCGKDEKKVDENSSNPFIGTWKLETHVNNGVDKTDDCNRKSTTVFTENTIVLNAFSIQTDKSCASKKFEFTYSYSNGKVSNIKDNRNGRIIDDIITFVIENNQLIMTQVDGNAKSVTIYKKQ